MSNQIIAQQEQCAKNEANFNEIDSEFEPLGNESDDDLYCISTNHGRKIILQTRIENEKNINMVKIKRYVRVQKVDDNGEKCRQ